MTANVADPDVPAASPSASPPAKPAALWAGYRFELSKLAAAWRIRLVLLVCWVAPAGFVAVVSNQSSLPTDTVFGRWMHATGWSGSLVVLAFACSWALPLLTSLVAGDVFAAEDRLGTWRHLVVAMRSPQRIFASKALASLTVILAMVAGLTVSSMVGGLLGAGSHPLVGLDGHLLTAVEAARAVLLAWLYVLAPTLAFAAVGLLGSVVLGRSPTGLLVPAVLALAMDLVLMLPVPVAVRVALPSNAFLAWRGLFTEPRQDGALLAGIAVSLLWAAAATALARHLFVRRDLADLAFDGAGRGAVMVAVLPLAGLVAVTAVVAAVAVPGGGAGSGVGSGVGKAKLDASLATTFGHLYRLQTRQLNRPAVTERQLQASADCDKGGPRVEDRGPGGDWRCVVSWRLPGSTAVGSAIYQLDVTPDGRYVADGDGPKEVNGFFLVHTPEGDMPNPLWQLDASVDLLTP